MNTIQSVERIPSARLRAECKYMGVDYRGKTRSDMINDLKCVGLFEVDTRWPAKPPRIDTSNRKDDLSNVFIGNGAGKHELESNKLYIANDDTRRPLIGGDFKQKVVTIHDVLNIGESSKEIDSTTPGKLGDMRRHGASIYMYREGEGLHSGWYPIMFGSMVLF